MGLPEGRFHLAEAALYLATAPKSNRIYTAFKKTDAVVDRTGSLQVPLHIRNAPTRLMKELGYEVPTKTYENYTIMGKTFDYTKPDEYVKSFKIGRV